MTRLSDLYLRALLRLLPRRFRKRHGAELLAVTRRMRCDLGPSPGPAVLARFYATVTWDLVRHAPWQIPGGRSKNTVTSPLERRIDPVMKRPVGFSWLDIKLGVRMLARYPGIAVVGTVAIAVAIALGTFYFEAVNKFREPGVSAPGGEPLVSIHNWDAQAGAPEPQALYDFRVWSREARTVDNLGAAHVFVRNLATGDGRVEPVRGAEITAGAFPLMGATPLLGRTLTDQDEDPAEPPVVVLGHALWKSRFDSDPGIIGRTVKLGTVDATVVGVMPEGFSFPATQRIWAPLRVNPAATLPRQGPPVAVFGRLVPGHSMTEARAELAAIGERLAAAAPATHENLRPLLTAYGNPLPGGGQAQFVNTILTVVNGIFLALLAIISMNVATLVFARTAGRGWEISVRNALGASRTRIVVQLFAEALVLTGLAAVVGLVAAKVALTQGLGMMQGSGALPFWIDDSLSWQTILYTVVMTLFGAAIIGVLPALRATRLNVQEALRNAAAGRSSLRFGGFWTTVIVAQVALTVALIPLALNGVSQSNRFMQRAEGIGAERYLAASIGMNREDYASDAETFNAHARFSFEELERRLLAEPGVEEVAFADRLPVEDQFKYAIEVDTTGGVPATGSQTSTMVQVSENFFDTFGTSVVAGRAFRPLDFEMGNVILVNQGFVQHVLEGRNAVGQRVRIAGGENSSLTGDTWYEIVGVVANFGWQLPSPAEQAAIYRPRLPRADAAMKMAVRTRDPGSFGPRLRAVALGVDPRIQVTEVQPLARVGGGEATTNWALTSVVWLVCLVVMTLSATGIHALMAFIVARRTREIGIRSALGATPQRIIRGVFARALLQVGLGIVAGGVLAALIGFESIPTLLGAGAVMLVVGTGACAVPLRRALRIDPTEALRSEV